MADYVAPDISQMESDYEKAYQEADGMNGIMANNGAYSWFGKAFGYADAAAQRQALLNSYMSNAYNTMEAEKNRQWQTEMSNTAYQRQARDLEALGFSPMALLGGSGASTPSGYAAHSDAKTGNTHGSDLLKTLIGAATSLAVGGKAPVLKVIAGNDNSSSDDNSSTDNHDEGPSWSELMDMLDDNPKQDYDEAYYQW